MIELAEIKAGDIVTLQDIGKNVAVGEVVSNDLGHLSIEAFGQLITFAKPTRGPRGGRLSVHPHLRIVGHVPTLFA
jgi:hypothetical protein